MEYFIKTTLPDVIDDSLQGQLDSLSLDDPDTCVAKVTRTGCTCSGRTAAPSAASNGTCPARPTLLSASYDGSVRTFDANKQVFEEIFATYDDSAEYETKLGYGTDRGNNSWIQSMALDSRHEGGKCLFLPRAKVK